MSQNSLFSRRLEEALREAATSPVTIEAMVGGVATINEQLRAALEASVDVGPRGLENVSIHIHRPAVCNRCTDESKEAFPYMLTTIFGDEYAFLCNDCWWWLMNAGLIASVEDEVWPDEEE